MKAVSFIPLAALIALPACAGSVDTAPAAPSAQAQAQVPMANMPLKFTARPTVAAITAPDLMSRLYVFADDSMGGRAVGTEYNLKGAAYIARELQKLGVQPAGENGTYFQDVPVGTRNMNMSSSLTVDGKNYKAGTDFVGTGASGPRTLEVVYMGQSLDTTNVPAPGSLAGKVVAFRGQAVQFTGSEHINKFVASDGFKRYQAAMQGVAGSMVIAVSDALPPQVVRNATASPNLAKLSTNAATTVTVNVTPALAAAVFGPLEGLAKGTAGKAVNVNLSFTDSRLPGRNVIGVIPGSDPQLRGQYVAIGAHNDHDPMTTLGPPIRPQPGRAVDHDSVRAFNTIFRPGGAEDEGVIPAEQRTAEQWGRVNAMKDSLRARNGGMRLDSIMNGADDDGSGSMAMLEIAEAFAKAPTKPKRSLLFIWYTGEERGMWGSGYYLDNPTVTRDSIVSAINVDMVGRGFTSDLSNAGPRYLQLLGSRRISKEYGDLIETVNTETGNGFTFDYQYDAPGHPQNFYCRSDHWSFARYDIPVVFFSTGGHRDYHVVTDEPQYINYPHYTKVTQFIHDVMDRVANLDHSLKVDKKVGNPGQACVQ